MSTPIAPPASTAIDIQKSAALVEKVVIGGDLSRLTPAERMMYYQKVCESAGLNPLTRPFDYLVLNGKMVLYAKRDATDQLRKIHGVSVTISSREKMDDVYLVIAKATIQLAMATTGEITSRSDESIGAVNIAALKGDALANALMKAETKAKRRVTLSICGLGLLDETEVETIPGVQTEDTRPVHTGPRQTGSEQLAARVQEAKTRNAEVTPELKLTSETSKPIPNEQKLRALLNAGLVELVGMNAKGGHALLESIVGSVTGWGPEEYALAILVMKQMAEGKGLEEAKSLVKAMPPSKMWDEIKA